MKGTIVINNTKKGFEVQIKAENGKTYKPNDFNISRSEDGKSCEFELAKGLVDTMSIEGRPCDRKISVNNQPVARNDHHVNQTAQRRDAFNAPTSQAKAPYNFIPLNSEVVPGCEQIDMSRYHSGAYSGYIDLEIETLTPLYIRGTGAEEGNGRSDFFSPGGKVKIPGSSLRGMVRELLEIASFGKFTCDDRRLFFRNIGDKYYRDKMTNAQNGCFPRAKAGYLIKRGRNYLIRPARKLRDTDHYRINGQFRGEEFHVNGMNFRQFTFIPVYFQPVAPVMHNHNGGRLRLRYALVNGISLQQRENHVKGVLVSSGKFGRKKHMQWIINEPDDVQSIEISPDAIKIYENDVTRDERADLLAILKREPGAEVPCFYLTDGAGGVTAFGHTALFRHPYEYTTHEHFPKALRDASATDYVESIFGKLEKFAGRVFFEDAALLPGQKDIFLQETSPKILSGPKPTTFQHYLDQGAGNVRHWGDRGAALRGYKLYWHRKTPDKGRHSWNEGRIIHDTQHTVIKPVREKTRFRGRVRFENLSDVELGGLLFVLDLPGSCRHKLGMAKPLGLGSVHIRPGVIVTDRKDRYSRLFDDSGWSLAETMMESEKLVKAFESAILGAIPVDERAGANGLWSVPRLSLLRMMLDWGNVGQPDWNEKTRYMEIENMTDGGMKENEFKNRPVLPGPAGV